MTVYSVVDTAEEEKASVSLEKILAAPEDFQTLTQDKDSSRGPASISIPKTLEHPDDLSVEIFCETPSTKRKVAKHLVMLNLSSCRELKDKYQLWVRNETNGFKAQIFKVGGQRFKTDFLQLNKGSNKLHLEGILKDGQKVVQTLEIESGS